MKLPEERAVALTEGIDTGVGRRADIDDTVHRLHCGRRISVYECWVPLEHMLPKDPTTASVHCFQGAIIFDKVGKVARSGIELGELLPIPPIHFPELAASARIERPVGVAVRDIEDTAVQRDGSCNLRGPTD